jgi:hypothetical protein
MVYGRSLPRSRRIRRWRSHSGKLHLKINVWMVREGGKGKVQPPRNNNLITRESNINERGAFRNEIKVSARPVSYVKFVSSDQILQFPPA